MGLFIKELLYPISMFYYLIYRTLSLAMGRNKKKPSGINHLAYLILPILPGRIKLFCKVPF